MSSNPLKVVVGLYIDKDRKILIQQRGKEETAFPEKWEFPGGKVEKGESDLIALAREWYEELGVKIFFNQNEPLFIWNGPNEHHTRDVQIAMYLIYDIENTPFCKENQLGIEMVSINELKDTNRFNDQTLTTSMPQLIQIADLVLRMCEVLE